MVGQNYDAFGDNGWYNTKFAIVITPFSNWEMFDAEDHPAESISGHIDVAKDIIVPNKAVLKKAQKLIMKYGIVAGDFVKVARTYGADYEVINNSTVVWKKGVWIEGTWNYGRWIDGTWENGEWLDGIWVDGTWERGTWHDGTWQKGIWMNGNWLSGVWINGDWVKGTWLGGKWKGGNWHGGKDKNGDFHGTDDSPDKWDIK